MTKDWDLNTKSSWDTEAISWDERSKAMWTSGSRKTIIPFFNKHIPKEGHVVDLGCGSGYGTYLLKKSGYDVSGIDLSEEMIRLAKENLAEMKISFQTGNVDALPFSDQSISSFLMINVIEWTKDPLHTLNELKRVLKPGGHLCVGILGATSGPRANSYPRLRKEPFLMNTMMPWELFQLAKENEFELVAQEFIHKKDVTTDLANQLDDRLQQAISFMTLFILKKVN